MSNNYTDVTKSSLVINKLTKAQYEASSKDENQLWILTDVIDFQADLTENIYAPSKKYEGQITQHIGETSGKYIQGYFYKCVAVGEEPNITYVWQNINSQPAQVLNWGNIGGTLSEQTDLKNALDAKQDTLTAGTNITITNNVISSTAQESFFRGRFEDWVNVPTDPTLYQANFRGETTPCNSDYMVVDNASGYVNPDFSKDPDNIAIRKSLQDKPYGIDITIGETTTHYTYTAFPNWTPLTESGWVSIKYSAGSPGRYFIKTNVTYYVDNERHNENTQTEVMVTNQSFETVHYISKNPGVAPIPLRGGWNFGYFGTWDEDGKNGWKPQYQVEDVLPIASPTEQGIAKLYNTTGQNTDGSMNQKSITDALDAKQDTLTAGTNITIEEDTQTGDLVISSTAQESFFRGNFNEWSDVPTDTSLYVEDIHGNRVPKDTDFIVIEDASQFIPSGELMHKLVVENLHSTEVFTIRITDENGVSQKYYYQPYSHGFVAIDDYYSLSYNSGIPGYWYIKTNDGSPIIIKGTTYSSGAAQLCTTSNPAAPFDVGMPPQAGQYTGAWRFAYYGVWTTAGLTGWTPQYKIENTLPIANETTFGIAKLYTTTGQNTDGSMTQKSITDAINRIQDSCFRGNWNTWTDVPVNANLYPEDYKYSHIPTYNDYMVVNDASGYVPSDLLTVELIVVEMTNSTCRYTIGTDSYTRTRQSGQNAPFGPNNEMSWNTQGMGTEGTVITFNDQVKYQDHIYNAGESIRLANESGSYSVADLPKSFFIKRHIDSFAGAWRFSYQGVWATDGKSGWKDEYQIENTLPIATPTVAGITKLYTTTGSNTDGTMDQNSITTELNGKLDTVSTADRVYGTDSQGNQTTYDKNSFGQVDDVQIHGDSKVVSKIANLSVVEQLTTMPAISKDNYGRIVQYIGETTEDYTHGYFYQAEALRVDSSKSVSADNATVTIANSENYFAWLTRLQTILGANRPIGFYILKTSNGTTYSADVYDTTGVSGAASGSRDTVNDWGLSFSGFENYDSETGTGTVLHLDVITGWTLIPVQPIIVDDQLSTTSTNPVQNKVITEELNKKSGVIFRQIIEEDD